MVAMSRLENSGQNHKLLIVNRSFENGENFWEQQ
jgi:hypothetical protein